MTAFSLVPLEVFHKDDGLTDLEVKVLCILLSFRGKNTNTVWPSRAAIAERYGYSKGTISNVLKRLETKGWLIRQKRVGTSKFEIVIPEQKVHRCGDNHRSSDNHQISEDHSHRTGELHSHRISELHSHRSSEMEQTIEQTNELTNRTDQVAGACETQSRTPAKSALVWDAYREAYQQRYGVEPLRDARTNQHLCRFIDRVGKNDAPEIARFFLTHNNRARHPASLLVAIKGLWKTLRWF